MKKLLIATILTASLISACSAETQTPLPTLTPVPVASTAIPPTQTPLPTPEPLVPTETASVNVSFANQILPIFQTYCVECHGGARTREGLNMTSYDALMAGSFNGAVIIPGNANESITVQLIVAGEMPERGPAVSSAEVQLIIDWINQGAQNN